jgi:hypothetical protein
LTPIATGIRGDVGRIRRGFSAAIVAAVATALIGPASAGAGAGVKAIKNCTRPENRPNQIVLSCAEAALYVDSLHWDVWKSNRAKGEGVLHQNECVPSCSTGTFRNFPVIVRLSKPRETRCGNKQVNIFRHVHLRFPGDRPDNHKAIEDSKLTCV